MDLGQWTRTVIPKNKGSVERSPTCKFSRLGRKTLKHQCPNAQHKPPKCYIKITGSRYNGTFLLNIDSGLDDAIYHTMRDIEVALEAQTDPTGKPKVSPKNCLSSVFQCFGTNEPQSKVGWSKKKQDKPVGKPAECALTATVNKSDLGPLISAVQSSGFNKPTPENSSERVMREVVDVFRSTLDQFRKDNQISSVMTQTSDISSILNSLTLTEQQTPTNVKAAKEVVESHDENKKVSMIRFSQEEVLVIQPPKPSVSSTEQLEVGIEVRPKCTASNVGQSIKLGKDKVLIGVEDGRGVLQINEGVPKRSLQMVIEEGTDGKPLVKVSLNEEDSDKNGNSTSEEQRNKVGNTINDGATQKCYSNRDYYTTTASASTMTNGNEHTKDSKLDTVKKYKSVESQVSQAFLKDKQLSENQKYKSESTQCQNLSSSDEKPSHCVCCEVGKRTHTQQTHPTHSANESTEVSQETVLQAPSEFKSKLSSSCNRTPYLVHTLHEPTSLQNSSAYFASDYPSMHFSIGRALNSKKPFMSKRQIKEPKSFSCSSDDSSSSKCTRIFLNIEEIEKNRTRDNVTGGHVASITNSRSDNFEKILKGMCGTSYLYHQPERPEPKSGEVQKKGPASKPPRDSPASLLFDQWTQTCCVQEVPGSAPTVKKQRLTRKSKGRESGDGLRSRISGKKGHRATKSSKGSAPRKAKESSVSTSCFEDVSSSDSSGSKKQLVFPMLTASEANLYRSTSGFLNKNWITEKAESVVGQKIFAAIEGYNDRSEFPCRSDKKDSFIFPTCSDTSTLLPHGGNTVSVVNLALYEPIGPKLSAITEEAAAEVECVDEANASEEVKTIAGVESTAGIAPVSEPVATSQCFGKMKTSLEPESSIGFEAADEAAINNFKQRGVSGAPSYPIRFRSNSCQNLSPPAPSVEKKMTQKKLRYPHLTAADDNSFMNVCGILSLNGGELKAGQPFVGTDDKPNTRTDHALPPAIRSLLLPQPPSELNNYEQMCTYCCDRMATAGVADPSALGMSSLIDHHWCTPCDEYDSSTQLAKRRSLFKRTFFAMKTVRTMVTRKFSTLFRKMSIHSSRNGYNLTATGSLPFVAVPLEKKNENLQLYPRSE